MLGRSGFVDANALCFLWPQEMNNFRLLFVSNPANRPIFSHFSVGTPGAKEVVILCEREHFTLLRPCTSHPGHPIQVFVQFHGDCCLLTSHSYCSVGD